MRFCLDLPAVRKINICNPRLSDKSKNSTFKYVYDRNKLNEYMANYDLESSQQTLFQLGYDIENNVNADTLIDTVFKYLADSIQPIFQ